MPRPDDAAEVTLGAALRAQREAAGMTVEQVAAHTRIRATLIRDLEADSLASSGGTVYARGHVKSIAAALRVDPAPLLALFEQVAGQPEAVVEDPEPLPRAVTSFGGSSFAASAAAALHPERRTPRWGIALVGAGVVLTGLLAVGVLNDPKAPVTEAGLGVDASPSPSATSPVVVQTPPPGSVASKPPVTGAQLRLRVLGTPSWVSISSPTQTLFEGVLGDGEFKDFTDPTRLKVVIGNAVSVNLNCNGTDSGPAGAAGAVRRFECTQAGLKPL